MGLFPSQPVDLFGFKSISFLFLETCSFQFYLQSKCSPGYFTTSVWLMIVWLMLTVGQWPFQKVNVMCEELDSLTLIFHFFSHFTMMSKCFWTLSEAIVHVHELQVLLCRPRMCLMYCLWVLVSQTCIVHTEEDQEFSPVVSRNGCGSGFKFLHWFLFRIGVYLSTVSAGWNSLRVGFFWFWIVSLGAMFYRIPGLRLKMWLYSTVSFP
jgi:hypothetical protein